MSLKRLFVVPVFVFLLISGEVRAQDYGIPQRTEDNIVVASYNIKWFGELSHDLTKLAIVIENFDIILEFAFFTTVSTRHGVGQ